MRDRFNLTLDRLVRTEISLGRWVHPAFAVCGYLGFAVAVALGVVLTLHAGLSLGVLLLMSVTGAVTYIGVVAVTGMVTGQPQLTYYHHEVAIIAATASLLRIWGQPELVYLDIAVLGIGIVLAFGRVGCLLVGCCHGRPHGWGVRYRAKHAAAGFPVYLTGVRLFPIQAVELLLVVGVLLVGTAHVLRGDRPGGALTWYVAIYGAGRFWLEFARGDVGRRYFAGFSEAQWTSAVLMCAAVIAERFDLLPFQVRDVVAALGVLTTMVAVAGRRRFRQSPVDCLRRADHVKEVAEALEHASTWSPATQIHVSRTSLGIQISGGRLGGVHHYALSAVKGTMSDETASTLADLILKLTRNVTRHNLIRSRAGVFHLVADSGQESVTRR